MEHLFCRQKWAGGWLKAFNSICVLQAEVEETLKRIESHKGVIGTLVVNAEGKKVRSQQFSLMQRAHDIVSNCDFSGIPIRTSLDNSAAVQYAGLLSQLTMKARNTVRDIDPQNDLIFLRIRSKKHEIMVAPGKCVLLVKFKKNGYFILYQENNWSFWICLHLYLLFSYFSENDFLLIVIQNPCE